MNSRPNPDLPRGTAGAPPSSGRRLGLLAWAPRGLLALLVACLLAGTGGARGQDAELEYKVKAAFLFNFIGFVEWPTNKLAVADREVIIGCLPDDPAAPILARALEGKVAEGRRIKLATVKEGEESGACHILFLSRARKSQVEEVLARLKKTPVLTVSELDQFAERGGMINLVRHERTYRFEVNLGAAEQSGLRISSKLASMATIIKSTSPP